MYMYRHLFNVITIRFNFSYVYALRLSTWQSSCSHEFKTTMIIQKQKQASQNPTMDGGGTNEVPPLAEELLVLDVFRGCKNQFSLGCDL